jgi:SAM-dependent methyltransferase
MFYDGPDITGDIDTALRAAGLDPAALAVDDLAALDEFHALGRPATLALADLAGVAPDTAVLDVGAGIGGPARVLADRYGARVTAVDATPRFCRAAARLCTATGLADRIDVVCADALALPLDDASVDLAWIQAVGQNIADKRGLAAELARVVRPGGRLALFEVVAGPGGPLHFPVPWADGPEGSFLVSAADLRALFTDAGFTPTVWNEGEAVQATIVAAAQEMGELPAHAGVALDLLMPDYEARMAGVARNIGEQRIGLVQAVLSRA